MYILVPAFPLVMREDKRERHGLGERERERHGLEEREREREREREISLSD